MLDTTLLKTWWKVSLRPSTAVFRDRLTKKSNLRTLVGVTAGALLGLILSWLVHVLLGQSSQTYVGIASIWVAPGTEATFGSWTIICLIGVIVGFYDFEIVLYIFARLLGGKGSYGAQAYAQSLFYAPLAILQQILVVIPQVGHLLFFLIAVLSLVPTTTSLRAAHGYSTLRAVITWVLPIVLNIVVVFVMVKSMS